MTKVTVHNLPLGETAKEGRFFAKVDGENVGWGDRAFWQTADKALECGDLNALLKDNPHLKVYKVTTKEMCSYFRPWIPHHDVFVYVGDSERTNDFLELSHSPKIIVERRLREPIEIDNNKHWFVLEGV